MDTAFPLRYSFPGFTFHSTRSLYPWLMAVCPLHRFRLYIKPSTRLDRPVNQSLAIDYPPRGRSPPTVSARRSVCCPGVTVDRFHQSCRYRLAFPGTGNLTQPMVKWTVIHSLAATVGSLAGLMGFVDPSQPDCKPTRR